MILYKLTGINNNCLKVCLRVYRRSSEFITMCSEFDIDLWHCGVIKSHVFSHFYAVVDMSSSVVFWRIAFYSFSFVYILYSTAVIWRINFIIGQDSTPETLSTTRRSRSFHQPTSLSVGNCLRRWIYSQGRKREFGSHTHPTERRTKHHLMRRVRYIVCTLAVSNQK